MSTQEELADRTVVAYWTGPEWAEVGHRLARVAGIEVPRDERGCRWIAVRAHPQRLDLIARRIHQIQQDLRTTAAHVPEAAPPRVASTPSAVRNSARRAP
ncbi:hypothetical protein ABTY53_13200 [Streptomyces noursei]|uniref:hypothetical protein n=1 Tax=Streptomyces noursei TaxID=1971 RepID=UPI0033275221